MNREQKKQADSVIAIIGIIFFIGLAFVARGTKEPSTNPKKTFAPVPSATVEVSKEGMEALVDANNYQFTYTIIQNDDAEIIEGKVYANKKMFTIIGKGREQFAKLSSQYLVYNGSEYVVTNEEIRSYFPYLNLEDLEDVLEVSTSEKNDSTITYHVDVPDLLDEYTDLDYDGFDNFKEDSVVLTLKDKMVSKIEIDFSNYFTYVSSQDTTFKIRMEFNDFGKVEDFEI